VERAAWVSLSAVPGLGPARFRRLLQEYGTPRAALAADPCEVCQHLQLAEEVAEQVAALPAKLEEIAGELASLDEQGVRALIWEDDQYPARLLSTTSPPPVLWYAGSADLNGRAVAVVGSREVSDEALGVAAEIAAGLAGAGILVVSGLADGVDAASHQGAMRAGGPTVGICGCGVMTALIQGRGGLGGQVAEAGGLCSELAPPAPLLPQALFARDRIIAGMAEAVIVVEARAGGGAVHTGRCAIKEGRPLFAVAWDQQGRGPGNRELIAEGAELLEVGEDVLARLRRSVGWDAVDSAEG
jgi:DNA processing protein